MFPLAVALSLFASCRPKPIDIDIPQRPADMSIASVAFDEQTVFVSAGYSVSSFANLEDTSAARRPAGVDPSMLIDDGLVTLSGPAGTTDTLARVATGLYGSRKLHLQPGQSYILLVKDRRNGRTATARTTFQPKPVLDSLIPVVKRQPGDTVVRLRLSLSNVRNEDFYVLSYTTPSGYKQGKPSLSKGLSMLTSFAPKRIELFRGTEAAGGRITKEVTLHVKGSDTVLVHLGKVDDAYFQYLTAYKRSGYLINQISGEPVNLPSNIITGLGFFSLYDPRQQVFDLNQY